MPAFTATPTVDYEFKVEGQKLAEDVRSMLVETVVLSTLSGPDEAVLTFADRGSKVADDSKLAIGKALEVTVIKDSSPTILFKGEIVELESLFDERGSTFVIRAMDKTHRLLSGRKVEVFKQTKYSDIVRTLGQAAGLRVEVDATSVQHEAVLRANETPWELITRLASELGYVSYSKAGTLYFKAAPRASTAPSSGSVEQVATAKLVAGENLTHVRVSVQGTSQVKEVTVRGWDPKAKKAVVGKAGAATTTAVSPMGAPAVLAARFGSPVDLLTGTPYRTQAEAVAAAKGRAERIASGHTLLTGEALGDPNLLAGEAVSVGGVGTRFGGKYILTEVRHSISLDGYSTEITASGSWDLSFLGLAGPHIAGADVRRRIDGVVPAIVTNITDPDGLGRVKVKFPWLDDQAESDWARVCQVWAGNGYGAMLLPEVNDEVLVAFEQGDVQHPYIVGSLYNGKDKPDKKGGEIVKGGKVAARRLVSSTKQGIVFFDESGKKGLRLRTGDEKYFIDVNQTGTTIDVSSDGTVKITAKKDLTIESKANISMKATQNVTIEGQKVEIKGKSGATVDGGAGPTEVKTNATLSLKGLSAELTGQTNSTVKGNAMLTLQGGVVKIN